MADPLTRGSRGEGVRDLQSRLGVLGYRCDADPAGVFGGATEASVNAFQRDRGLRVDGVVGRHTWSSLVESGFALGDRLLYFRQPLVRGDDVADLQRRLNTLGFDARRVDGLFGPETHRALVEFQRSAGLVPDGICGPDAVAALDRVGGMAAGSVATVRERDEMRRGPHRIEGRRIFVAAAPGLAVVGDNVARRRSVVRRRRRRRSSRRRGPQARTLPRCSIFRVTAARRGATSDRTGNRVSTSSKNPITMRRSASSGGMPRVAR